MNTDDEQEQEQALHGGSLIVLLRITRLLLALAM
jgi:hypothetical protein